MKIGLKIEQMLHVVWLEGLIDPKNIFYVSYFII